MTIVAVPVFRSRISPVFDFSLRVLLVRLRQNREIKRTELSLQGFSPAERVAALTRAGAATLICGGISDSLHTMLEGSGIHVIWGMGGSIDDVLKAFMSNSLDDPKFHIPGRSGECLKPFNTFEGGLQGMGSESIQTFKKERRANMFKKILAATDLPTTCDTRVSTAAEIARQNNATLHILHILESAYSGKYRHFVKHFETGEEIVSGAEYEQKIKEHIDKNCSEVLKGLSDYEIRVTPGFPWEQTLKLARKEDVDLIVLGPHSGRAELRGVSRFSGRIGSTVEGVITRERCPVMIVNRPIPTEQLAFNKIMVCIDFSKSCKYALQFAVKMAQKYGSKLFMFHMFVVPSSSSYPQDELEQEAESLNKKLETFCNEMLDGIDHEYAVWEGTLPHLEILKYARDKNLDLIAMGSHTKEKGEKWYVGSAVEQVSSRSISPVVVVTDPKVLLKIEN